MHNSLKVKEEMLKESVTWPTLNTCGEFKGRFAAVKNSLLNALNGRYIIPDVIMTTMAVTDIFNPNQWEREIKRSFREFFTPNSYDLFSLDRLHVLCNKLKSHSYAPLAQCAAGILAGTITMDFEASYTFLGRE